jgi:3,4-dihydroxy 2-butanone 4-phosphate synthase/GTP cyclohydrolase II
MTKTDYSDVISSTEEIIEDARNGRMFILVDHEDRENEGDLVIPAQMCTPQAINFMATHGRGLICLAMPAARIDALGLPLMSPKNSSRHETAFTLSIEAREGVSTGISAADRARTVSVAIDPSKGAADIATPGHIFPLRARDGGVLVRAGHTEAAVDVSRLAGLNASGVICEIMNDDGTMARMPDLVAFAQHHGLKLGTIADLIAYRRRTEKLVRRVEEGEIEQAIGGTWRAIVYESTAAPGEHLALVKGDVGGDAPVLVRMHAASLFREIVSGRGLGDLHAAMRMIEAAGRGVVVLLRDPRPDALSIRLKRGPSHAIAPEIRDYGIGAQILDDLGVKRIIRLSNNPRPLIGLDGYGLQVLETRPIPPEKP